jgi:lipopolysaccharide biosynthesis protein
VNLRPFSFSRLAASLQHVVQKVLSLTLGAVVVSRTGKLYQKHCVTDSLSQPWPAIRAAIIFHAYYPELIDEALKCRALLPKGTPLIITVPPDRYHQAEQALAHQPDIQLYAVPNRGRDIAPFFMLLNTGFLDAFDAVLKIHSKRSPHLLDGEIRRKLLFHKLCGSQRKVFKILNLFTHPKTAIVGWKACYRKALPYWMGNESRVAEIAKAIRASSKARLGFFEGSMFWVRPDALKNLRALDLQPEDFEEEAGQLDGMYHHALERCFTIAVWANDDEVRDTDGGLLTGGDLAGQGP